MTILEKRSVVHLIAMLVYVAVCAALFIQRHPAGISDETLDYRFLAVTVLLLIPMQIAVAIAVHIAFNMVNPAARKNEAPYFEDERDKLIELKSLRNAYQTFLVGFLLAMLTLVLFGSPAVAFIMLVLTFFAVQLAWGVSQFYFYRRGF